MRVTWAHGRRSLERVFTLTVDNPGYGKPVVDPQAEALKKEFPDSRAVALWQGAPLGDEKYEGCSDAFISTSRGGSDHGSANFGAKDHLWAGPYATDHRTLIRFDLSKILPGDAKVRKAYLKLYMYNGGRPDLLAVHSVLRPWGAGRGGADREFEGGLFVNGVDWQHLGHPAQENECSWTMSRRPAEWSEPGCGEPGEDHEAWALGSAEFDTKEAAQVSRSQPCRYWIRWDVTDAVQEWAENPELNFGLLVKLAGKKATECRFHSADYHDPPFRPRLIAAFE